MDSRLVQTSSGQLENSESDRLEETLSFVLSFLRDVGLRGAEQALVQEISQKYPDFAGSAAESDEPEEESDLDEPSPATTSATLDREDVHAADTTFNDKAFAAEVMRPVAAGVSQRLDRQSRDNSQASKYSFLGSTSVPPPWGSDVDEYENMDDVGYNRKPVLSQRLFVELELDLTHEEGTEGYFVHNAKGRAQADNKDAPDCVSNKEEQRQQQQQPEQSRSSSRKIPSPTKMPSSVLARCMSSSPADSHGNYTGPGPSSQDLAGCSTWGMETIKIADPVVIDMSLSRGSRSGDDSKPVLSRVESLSSSFKDFDLERLDDELYSGRIHETDNSDIDMVEFSPSGTCLAASVIPLDLEMFTSPRKTSPSNSLTSSIEQDTVFRLSCSLEETPSVAQLQCLQESPSEIPKEQKDAAGGFSFPVASSADEPLQKVYKSWPSVRRASDEINLDDAVAFMDEDYLSKLSSRAPSVHYVGSRTSPGSPVPLRRGHTHSDSGMALPPATEREPSLVLPSRDYTLSASSTGAADAAAAGTSDPKGDAQRASLAQESWASQPETSGVCVAPGVPIEELASAGVVAELGPAIEAPSMATASVGSKEVLAHQIRLGSADSRGFSKAASSPDPGLSGASDVSEDGDSASLVDGPFEAQLDWHVIPFSDEAHREEEDGVEGQEEEEREGGRRSVEDSALDPEPQVTPRYSLDESGALVYHYDMDFIHRKYEVFPLQVIHRRHRTGFEETKDFPIRMNDLIAGRYQVMDFLGAAAFSRAVQALDVKNNRLVCLKIVKNNKDYFDQSLDEIKLLKFVNSCDPEDEQGVVRLYDYFYYKEHLFLVCELLRANLYEFQKYNKESGEELYFTNARIQKIATSVLRSLAFLHSLDLIHSDLKPENILVKSYSRCEVKTIDLGSSCFITDQLSSYVQSRSYRAPEVILGLPYDQKVDVWSLGCILAELSSGYVLFQNDSVATLLARLEGILGPMPEWMLRKGRYSHRFFTKSGHLYERCASSPTRQGGSTSGGGAAAAGVAAGSEPYELLSAKKTSMRHRLPDADTGLLDFISYLLCVDPLKRPTAAEAMHHPWLQQTYASLDSML